MLGSSHEIVEAGQTTPCGACPERSRRNTDFYPFGSEHAYTNSCQQNYKFTGKERDPESGLDNFEARYYGSSIGRFTSPDDPFVGWQLNDPQSLNLYAYVQDNPINDVDPTGHCLIVNGGSVMQCGFSELEAAMNTMTIEGWNYTGIGVPAPDTVGMARFNGIAFAFGIAPKTPKPPPTPPPTVPSCTNDPSCYPVNRAAGVLPAPPPQTPKKPQTQRPQTPRNNHCLARATGSAVLHGAIDALGMVPLLGEFSGPVSATLSALTNNYSDKTGTELTGGGIALSSTETALKAIGTTSKAAEAIPIAGTIFGAFSLVYDGYAADKQYNACVAGGRP